jgi:hypothetical protein
MSCARAFFGHAHGPDGVLYVHGGQDEKGAILSDLVAVAPTGDEGILPRVSPVASGVAVSHHSCCVVGNNFLVVVGGWNGRSRSAGVQVARVDQGDRLMEQYTLIRTKKRTQRKLLLESAFGFKWGTF